MRTRRLGAFEVHSPWLPIEETVGATVDASRAAYEMAGIGPEDVDVIQLQDTDAGAEVIHLAENGFCADGEQEALVADGALEIGGAPAGQHRRRAHRERRADRRVGAAAGARGRAPAARPRRANGRCRATRRSATPSSTARPGTAGVSILSTSDGHPRHARAGRAAARRPGSSRGELGPATVADLDDADRTQRLAAAVRDAGWLELRDDAGEGAPLAGGVEAAIVADALGGAVADVAFAGPVLARDLARRAGVRDRRRRARSAFAPALTGAAVGARGDDDHAGVRRRRRPAIAADAAYVLVADGAGYRLARVRRVDRRRRASVRRSHARGAR